MVTAIGQRTHPNPVAGHMVVLHCQSCGCEWQDCGAGAEPCRRCSRGAEYRRPIRCPVCSSDLMACPLDQSNARWRTRRRLPGDVI